MKNKRVDQALARPIPHLYQSFPVQEHVNDGEENEVPEHVAEEFRQFENQHKPNLEETETVNLKDGECVKEIRISVHMTEAQRRDLIKEEITKQIESQVVEVTQYPTWLANVVPVAKKDGNIRICVDYRDLNKASPKDNFPLPNIHILIDNCAKHEMQSMDPLKYIFQKEMPTGKLAKWQMLLSEFDIVTYFPDEDVSFVGEDISEAYLGWRVFFDGAANHQGKGIGAVLVSESGQHYPMAAKLRFNCTNNMAEYEACILGLKMAIDMNVHELLVIGDSDLLIHQVQGECAVKNPKITPYVQYIQKLCKRFRKIEFRYTPRTQNELADALATIASMIKHPDTSYIDPVDIEVKEQPVYFSYVEAEPDGLPWYFDIKNYLETGTYPENATFNQKKSIRRMALNFFASGEVLYMRTLELGLLRCVDADEAVKLLEQIHVKVCGTHMNGLTLARKILRAGYRTTVKTSVGATPYLLVYGTEAVIPAEVEIPSLRIIQEAELSDAEWVRKRIDQLTLIDENRMVAVCHGQLSRQRMIRAFHKKVRARILKSASWFLKRIFLHQDDYKGKFAPNWQGPYMVRKVLSGVP
ncbi:uncharacterized protein [Solanum tuberosum]|uniref:uncharacterized protein n=1 Tax=Solanum tuberosum TaxID=4113 RepID=UPI00073A09E6|nr:PREDICTED: uncharacterized protein LOC107058287 [Solanum tuberosum]